MLRNSFRLFVRRAPLGAVRRSLSASGQVDIAAAAATPAPVAVADLIAKAPVATTVGASGVPKELDVAISFDVTKSMSSALTEVRNNLDALSTQLFDNSAALGVDARLAVIAQADYDAVPYVTKHADFSDAAGALKFLRDVPTSTGVPGWNGGEAYGEALKVANGLAWRPTAAKALVLLGDDKPHEPGAAAANAASTDWRAEAAALAARGVAVFAVQCPTPACPIGRARFFYEGLAAAHPGGAYLQLQQFASVPKMLMAVFHAARKDLPALAAWEGGLVKSNEYSREIELVCNTLLGRPDANRAAAAATAAAAGSGGGTTAAASPWKREQVTADTTVAAFVQGLGLPAPSKRRHVYYYQFARRQRVRAGQAVLVLETASGSMLTGDAARGVLGLAPGADAFLLLRRDPSGRAPHVPAGHKAFLQCVTHARVRQVRAGTEVVRKV